MNESKKMLAVIVNLSLIALVFSVNLPACLGADSPQYILNVFAVDSAGTSLTPVTPTLAASQNQITIAIAVTTQVPAGLTVTESGFTISGSGTPNPGLDSVSNPVTTVTNTNGSVTTKYVLQITVVPGSGVTSVGFAYFTKVIETTGQPAVTHDASPLQFTVTGASATPTASSSPSPSPTETPTSAPTENPTPTPTVPEFPVFILAIAAIITLMVAVGVKCKIQNRFLFFK